MSRPAAGLGRPTRVLFVCTGNSARSIMSEALLRHRGGDRFEVFSAGTAPRGVNPLTVRVLKEAGLPTGGLSSQPVSEFIGQPFDYVVTVCDNARQVCPVFPGGGLRLHWGLEDPAEATGSEEERLAVFRRIFDQIEQRIGQLVEVVGRDRSGALAPY